MTSQSKRCFFAMRNSSPAGAIETILASLKTFETRFPRTVKQCHVTLRATDRRLNSVYINSCQNIPFIGFIVLMINTVEFCFVLWQNIGNDHLCYVLCNQDVVLVSSSFAYTVLTVFTQWLLQTLCCYALRIITSSSDINLKRT